MIQNLEHTTTIKWTYQLLLITHNKPKDKQDTQKNARSGKENERKKKQEKILKFQKDLFRNRFIFFEILGFFLAFSFINFVGIILLFASPYKTKGKGEVMKFIPSTFKKFLKLQAPSFKPQPWNFLIQILKHTTIMKWTFQLLLILTNKSDTSTVQIWRVAIVKLEPIDVLY